jgi:GrpB-like predicted nucleotidyltransferase (UPF0157 family)
VEKHDSVIIVAPDPTWAESFAHARSDLAIILGARVLGIEHIGSTAVPGLSAKPIIDLLCGVDAMPVADECAALMRARGWEMPEDINRDLVERRFLLWRNADGVRTHHVHLVVHEGPLWREYVDFRDKLRSSALLRRRYEELKKGLAERFHDQRARYTASKTDFVKEVLGLEEAPRSRG